MSTIKPIGRPSRFEAIAALITVVTALLIAATPAMASRGADDSGRDDRAASARGGGNEFVIRTGRCSNGATWKLKAKHDDGLIETEFEVDSNRTGQRWRVMLRNQGALVFSGVRATAGRSGSFEVERRIANRAGAERIAARAVHVTSGATCTGSLSLA